MPDVLHAIAIGTANVVLIAAALAFVVGLAWLAVTTVRNQFKRAAKRLERIRLHEAARREDSNELSLIDLSRINYDAELAVLTRKEDRG